MPRWAVLVVVVVRDPGLRAALTAELGRQGANLLTASAWRGEPMERLLRQPAVLVVDEADLDGGDGTWIEEQWIAGRWQRVVMLSVDAAVPADAPDWLAFVDRGSAGAAIAALLDDWEGAAAPQIAD